MFTTLQRLEVRNYRSLRLISIELSELNALFGPNGSGKSTLLDTIWFLRDCIINGVENAASDRSHGVGALWQGAEDGDYILILLETELSQYSISLGYSSGRIEPYVGEKISQSIGWENSN
jgi:predicted ATPase